MNGFLGGENILPAGEPDYLLGDISRFGVTAAEAIVDGAAEDRIETPYLHQANVVDPRSGNVLTVTRFPAPPGYNSPSYEITSTNPQDRIATVLTIDPSTVHGEAMLTSGRLWSDETRISSGLTGDHLQDAASEVFEALQYGISIPGDEAISARERRPASVVRGAEAKALFGAIIPGIRHLLRTSELKYTPSGEGLAVNWAHPDMEDLGDDLVVGSVAVHWTNNAIGYIAADVIFDIHPFELPGDDGSRRLCVRIWQQLSGAREAGIWHYLVNQGDGVRPPISVQLTAGQRLLARNAIVSQVQVDNLQGRTD